ncbi:caspase family protein [Methylobacterium organophilum]|uniref:caspase family protein n=1 Tax=Methylobacterium organophilum TaxID=410 RepID=UPI001F139913|nr:caspase domain-containing protein [Methylobacterium organophilum]UMY18739.1 caspase family protein [Methylobacterium organophilum]
MRIILRPFLALLAALALVLPALAGPAAAGSEKRIALVIGNAEYQAGALATPANDAGLIAQTLQAAGFDVVGARDLDEESLRRALRDFTDKAAASGPDTVAFLYLSGYGLQLSGENYFAPVDAQIPSAADVPSRALRLSDYTRRLAAIPLKARFVVLDAARTAPFAKTGDPLAGGLALTEAEPGALIAFNAAPGTVGPPENGPYGAYAQALVEMIREGGLQPNALFERVRLRVSETTKGAEMPWHSARIDAPFVFLERAPNAPPVAEPQQVSALRSRPIREIGAKDAYAVCLERDTLEGYQDFIAAYPHDALAKRVRALVAARREAVTWRRTYVADTPDAYWSYLSRYPRGPHAWDARRRLRELAVALEPPPRFAMIAYDVPPPPPEEVVYVERPALYLDDPVYDFAPPPPPPAVFLPPPPAYIVDLAPPPPPVAYYALPVPAFTPVPDYVSAPAYVAAPPNNVIYENIHNTTVINTINERNAEIARNPGSAAAIGAGAVAGAALGAAAAHVALPPAVAQKAALRGPMPAGPGQNPALAPNLAPNVAPGQPGQGLRGPALPNGQPLPAQAGRPRAMPGAVPGQPGAVPPGQNPAAQNPGLRPAIGQPLPGTNGQPLPGQATRPGQPQQAGQPNPADPRAANAPGRALPGMNGQPLPAQAGRPGVAPGPNPAGAPQQAGPPNAAERAATAPAGPCPARTVSRSRPRPGRAAGRSRPSGLRRRPPWRAAPLCRPARTRPPGARPRSRRSRRRGLSRPRPPPSGRRRRSSRPPNGSSRCRPSARRSRPRPRRSASRPKPRSASR